MPTYEYQCNDCDRISEVRQRISDAPLTRCEACGGTLKRLLSAAPFILKGEGWYVTDYPSESRKKALASEKSAGPSTKTEGTGSTEKSSAPSTSTGTATPAPSKPSSSD